MIKSKNAAGFGRFHNNNSSGSSFLPERDYVTFWSLLSQIRLSSVCLSVVCLSVCNARAPYSEVETFGIISSPSCTLAMFWPPCKILKRSSQRNPFIRGVKRKRVSKTEPSYLCRVRVSHLLADEFPVLRSIAYRHCCWAKVPQKTFTIYSYLFAVMAASNKKETTTDSITSKLIS